MKFKKVISIILALSMILSLVACASGTIDKDDADKSEAVFTPGTYEGEAEGFHGTIKASVTVTETEITDITVDHTETSGLGDKAVEKIVMEVKGNTSLNIPMVSGATYSSKGILSAIAAALEKAGADIEMLKSKELEKNETAEDIDKTADVIVIGGGGAGLAAAVSAHQNGASVIVIEKMPQVGGNTIISGSAYNGADPNRQASLTMTDLEKQTVEGIINADQTDLEVKQWQETLKKEWEEYKDSGSTQLFDSPTLHKLQTYNGGDKLGSTKLIGILADNSLPAVEWLESLGMKFKDYVFTVLGGLWSRAHKPEKPLGTGYIETYMNYIEENSNDIEILVETKAEEFIVEGGVVKGVYADRNGGKVTLHANKGVVLAAGGFGANVEMREQYNTLWPSLKDIKTTNHTGATGDGIIMAEEINASILGMEHIQLLPMGDPVTGSLSGNIEQGVQNRIFVNKEGNRFVDEGERRDVMTKALMEQTDANMWVIVDKHSYPTGDTINNFNESIDSLVEAGRAYKSDTLEGLAELIGVDEKNLTAAVETFNQAVDGTTEDPFGRTLYADKIDTAPYYAGARVPTVHHTMGGVEINELSQVIGSDGQIIKGLYAAGEVTGGIHGSNRLGGNALADITVFGKIAGESAALAK
ncbi:MULTISPECIES: flavocytochrome c [unclassified Sedimentibacter]|uniref:flavocytochrome c n=1 Tax=unclassified Sedimentibacter TaxID=2649220 RepID=UPI0027DFC4F2|nr:flavocytochrome c [Sedimentibacter sp. MB35-C1]WMJ77775.1 flavocytochrome c [Sedimentibacter sp. MB35-C1]